MIDRPERFDDLPVLASLGEQLAAAAAAIEAPTHPARRWWRRRGLLGIMLAGLLPAAVAAAAVTGAFSPGAPVPRSSAQPAGAPVSRLEPGSSRVISLRAADPDGGPSWGIRVFRAHTGVTCVQVGRVVGGRVGVLGIAGAFGDDHRFHALPAQAALALHCGRSEPSAPLELQGFAGPLSASADPRLAGPRDVPVGDRRQVVWGFAGPRATSVQITVRGRTMRRAVRSIEDGAYLFVLRGTRTADRRTTTYRDGQRCTIAPQVPVRPDCVDSPGSRPSRPAGRPEPAGG